MTKPKLQLSLDTDDLRRALAQLSYIAEHVDIIKIGPILALSQGMACVRAIHQLYPQHTLVFDVKMTDASHILTRMAMEAGALWVTLSSAAHPETIRAAKEVAIQLNGDVQIELNGHWTWQDIEAWRYMGINQVIYHLSINAELAGQTWQERDFQSIKRLIDLGLDVSVNGGVKPDNVSMFKNLDIKTLIIGRSLLQDGGQMLAEAFHRELDMYW